MIIFFKMWWVLAALHMLADFPLQGEFLAVGKNRHLPLGKMYWKVCLLAHSTIHGFMVYLPTNSVTLGLMETVAHAAIDAAKCENKISLNTDQALHLLCKAVWVYLFLNFEI